MIDDDVRRMCLALPKVTEKSHFGKADFRIHDKIFATLPGRAHAVVKLTVEQQDIMSAAEPKVFFAVPGGWGRKGWTTIDLQRCDEKTLKSALRTAWTNVAPKGLRGAEPDR